MTTLHVANQCKAFSEYELLSNMSVAGVGRSCTPVAGHGTILLEAMCNGHRVNLQLEQVLHILSNRNNLLSLRQWDSVGGSYASTDDIQCLTLEVERLSLKGNEFLTTCISWA